MISVATFRCKWCDDKANDMAQAMLIAEATVAIMAEEVERLEQRIEAAKQRLESFNGQYVGQAKIHAVIEILSTSARTSR